MCVIKNRRKLKIRNFWIYYTLHILFVALLYICYFLVSFPTGSFQRARTNRKASRYSDEGTAKVATGSNPRSHARLGSPFSTCVCARFPRSSTQRPVLLPGGRHRGYPEGEPTVAAASRTAIIIFGHYAPYCSTNTPLSTYTYIPWVVEGYRTPGWGGSKSILL